MCMLSYNKWHKWFVDVFKYLIALDSVSYIGLILLQNEFCARPYVIMLLTRVVSCLFKLCYKLVRHATF
jgi:hypothetical protein